MDRETRLLAYLGLLIPLGLTAASYWQAADQFSRGGPEKSIRQTHIGPIDPLLDLAPLATEDAPLQLNVGKQSFSSLSIHQVMLKNDGKAPITPSDFVEPLRLHAIKGWNIVAIRPGVSFVDVTPGLNFPHLRWKKNNEQEFEAEPFLLNPGESIEQTVYLTQPPGEEPLSSGDAPPIYLTMRVINLTGFSGPVEAWEFPEYEPSLIYLTPGAAVFLVGIASVLLAWYLWALFRLGLSQVVTWKRVALIVLCAWLSYATAEVLAFFLFPGNPTYSMLGEASLFAWESQWHNWTILAAHLLAVGLLVRLLSRKGPITQRV